MLTFFRNLGRKYPYAEDIITVVKALAPDAEFAKKEQAALVYMGHGNDYSYIHMAKLVKAN